MKRAFIGFAAVLALSSGLALAAEIIYFTNGSAMPIQSYEVKDKTIHVVLGPNATMAFPMHLVDRIERGGVAVFPSPTLQPANQVASGGPGSASSSPVAAATAYPQDGSAGVPARFRSKSSRRSQWMDPVDQLEQAQAPADAQAGTPVAGPAGRRLRTMVGTQAAGRSGAPAGTYRVGDHFVLDASPGPARSSRGNITEIKVKPGTGVATSPPAGGDGSGTEEQSPPPAEDPGAGSPEEAPPEPE